MDGSSWDGTDEPIDTETTLRVVERELDGLSTRLLDVTMDGDAKVDAITNQRRPTMTYYAAKHAYDGISNDVICAYAFPTAKARDHFARNNARVRPITSHDLRAEKVRIYAVARKPVEWTEDEPDRDIIAENRVYGRNAYIF